VSYEISPGDRCRVTRDYLEEGELAFKKGALVVIEDISPDRLRPGAKYVVFSARLGRRTRLSGRDLERIFCKECGAELVGEENRCPVCGWVSPEG